MEFDLEEYTVKKLVEAFKAGSLTKNPEYQRGSSWSSQQKQALVDSIFRKYPIPAFFLEVKLQQGLDDELVKRFEIIDGQQRIFALVDYMRGNFPLLASDDPKLRLPLSMRGASGPWEGKRYAELSAELQNELLSSSVQAYLVRDVANSDEIRDLFIRLQSGTALTRQQVRDAWPGQLGPKIEYWAGKDESEPKFDFFNAVDGRGGSRDEDSDSKDLYVKHRTTCAQLCQLLLERAQNPFAAPSIKASDLDGLYHRYTTFTGREGAVVEIEGIFVAVQDIVGRIVTRQRGKKTVPKITLFALALFIQDLRKNKHQKLTTESKRLLAEATSAPTITANSRAQTGGTILDYYLRWRDSLPPNIIVEVDPKRDFSPEQKQEIRFAAEGKCAKCGEFVEESEQEYDHYPLPHYLGGKTEIENGRLVHQRCHPRHGKPRSD